MPPGRCYARFSVLSVPPKIELEMSLSFSLRRQQHATHCRLQHIVVSEVFIYHDHGSQPHTFTLSLLLGHVPQKEIGYICCSKVSLYLWNCLRVKKRT